jgi:deoxyribonuclease-4
MKRAFFGPGGNCDEFRRRGLRSTLDAPLFVREMGLDAYEYEAGQGLSANPGMLAAIGNAARESGVKMSYHTPYFISLSGVVTETRLKSIGYIKQSVEAAKLLGASTIVVHCGSCAKITRDEAMRLSADTLIRALDELDCGSVKIGLETMGKKNQLGTLDEVLELCRIDKTLVPVVDFGHLNARVCGGAFNSADDYMRVFDKISRFLSPEIAENLHCHFSKIEWTDAGEKRHLTFEDELYGPDHKLFCEAIARGGYTPTVICESAGTQTLDALTMKKYYGGYVK